MDASEDAIIQWQIDLIYRQFTDPAYLGDLGSWHLRHSNQDSRGTSGNVCGENNEKTESGFVNECPSEKKGESTSGDQTEGHHRLESDSETTDKSFNASLTSGKSEDKLCLSNSGSGLIENEAEGHRSSETPKHIHDEKDSGLVMKSDEIPSDAESEGSNVSGYCPSRRLTKKSTPSETTGKSINASLTSALLNSCKSEDKQCVSKNDSGLIENEAKGHRSSKTPKHIHDEKDSGLVMKSDEIPSDAESEASNVSGYCPSRRLTKKSTPSACRKVKAKVANKTVESCKMSKSRPQRRKSMLPRNRSSEGIKKKHVISVKMRRGSTPTPVKKNTKHRHVGTKRMELSKKSKNKVKSRRIINNELKSLAVTSPEHINKAGSSEACSPRMWKRARKTENKLYSKAVMSPEQKADRNLKSKTTLNNTPKNQGLKDETTVNTDISVDPVSKCDNFCEKKNGVEDDSLSEKVNTVHGGMDTRLKDADDGSPRNAEITGSNISRTTTENSSDAESEFLDISEYCQPGRLRKQSTTTGHKKMKTVKSRNRNLIETKKSLLKDSYRTPRKKASEGSTRKHVFSVKMRRGRRATPAANRTRRNGHTVAGTIQERLRLSGKAKNNSDLNKVLSPGVWKTKSGSKLKTVETCDQKSIRSLRSRRMLNNAADWLDETGSKCGHEQLCYDIHERNRVSLPDRTSNRLSKSSKARQCQSNEDEDKRKKCTNKRKSSEEIESTKRKVRIKTKPNCKNDSGAKTKSSSSIKMPSSKTESESGGKFDSEDPLYCLSEMEDTANQMSLKDMEQLMPLTSVEVSNPLTLSGAASNKTPGSFFGPPRHVGAVWKSIVSE